MNTPEMIVRTRLSRLVFLTLLMLTISLFCVMAAAGEPIEISDADGLQNVSQDPGGDYVLVDDIDLSGVNFEPLGDEETPFNGSLDGRGHAVYNLTLSGEKDGMGLFGYTGNQSEISNLTLKNAEVGESGSEATPVGGLVGWSEGDITDVYVSGVVIGESHVGGVVGLQDGGVLKNLSADIEVRGEGGVGGIVGSSGDKLEIRGSSSRGSVVFDSSVETSTLINNSRGGGIVGLARNALIVDCYSEASVSGELNTGGLVGDMDGEIRDSYSTGKVSGDRIVGGVAGVNFGKINQTYSEGEIDGDKVVGGLVGKNPGKISNSYFTGSVSGREQVGGLIGVHGWNKLLKEGDIAVLEDSYWTVESPDYPTVGGIERGEGDVVVNNVTPPVKFEENNQETDNRSRGPDGNQEEGLPGFSIVSTVIAFLAAASIIRQKE